MLRFVVCPRNIGSAVPLYRVWLIALLMVVAGCGSEVKDQKISASLRETSSAVDSTVQNRTMAQEELAAASQKPSPNDVVSQFLDRVRRGGKDSDAGLLLTQRAQSELNRIGRSVQPIGSPDAFFKVTRSEAIPGESDSMLVHSIWSEPNRDGSNSSYQVVWAVQRENAHWRISGLAMELQPGQPPTIIDFENGDLMAQLLDDGSESAESSQPAESQAASSTESLSR